MHAHVHTHAAAAASSLQHDCCCTAGCTHHAPHHPATLLHARPVDCQHTHCCCSTTLPVRSPGTRPPWTPHSHVYVYRDGHRRTHNTLHTCLAAHTHDQHCTHASTHTYSPTQIVLLHPNIVYYSIGTAPATSTATHHHAACLRLLFAFTNFQEQRGTNTKCTGKAPNTSSSPSDPHVLCTNLLCTTSRRCGYLCVLFRLSVQRACAVSNRWWELSCKRATKENWSNSIFLVPTTGSSQHIHGRTDMCIPVWSRLLGAEVCLWPVLHRGRTLEQRLAFVKLRDQVPAWMGNKKKIMKSPPM